MAKIYNEVVIDMNPESPTFEETIYEDSLEHEGDMMLAQGDSIPEGTKMAVKGTKAGGGLNYVVYKWVHPIGWQPTGAESFNEANLGDMQIYDSLEQATAAGGTRQQAYGLESLSKKDFFEADGVTQKSPEAIRALIKQHKPMPDDYPGGVAQYDQDMLAKINDMMPKLQAIPEEEKGFAREGFQKDVYGISKDAGKAGAQMQQAYGSGMGSQMRGAYAGMKDVTQQFKQAEQGYAQDIYGLEQKQEAEFEGDIGSWLENFKEGGRVPSNKRQTFSDVLSKIPDAGGN